MIRQRDRYLPNGPLSAGPVLLRSPGHGTLGIDRMTEDGSTPPLPRRAPGDSGWSQTEPVQAVTLPEPVVKRILAALDAAGTRAQAEDQPASIEEPAQDGATSAGPPVPDRARSPEPTAQGHASSSGGSTSLPQRVPGASDARNPPARTAPPALRAALPHFGSGEAATDPFSAFAVPGGSAGAQQAAEHAAPEQAAAEQAATRQAEVQPDDAAPPGAAAPPGTAAAPRADRRAV